MRLKAFLAAFLLSTCVAAHAQFTPGQVLTAAQLNSQFSLKTSNAAAAITGGTITGLSAPIPLGSGGTNATTATGATSQLQYLQGATGSAARSLTNKLQDVVSILDFPGCDRTGIADSTSCIQAALNSNAQSVYVPAGTYKESGLVLPSTTGFTLYGDGISSILVQAAGSIHYPTLASGNLQAFATIRDLRFDGSAGTANTLDTTYAQQIDLVNLTFINTPVGFSSLKLDGNPTSSTYMHDVRAKNIRIYSTTAGKAGIELGSWATDTSVDGYIMNGNFDVNYCIYANIGAQAITVSNSHPYNAKINVVYLAGNNNFMGWVGNTFDNALQDVFYQKNSNNGRFSNTFIEAINTSRNGIVFDNSFNNSLDGTICSTAGVTNAASCLTEVTGSGGNRALNTQVDSLAFYASPFKLVGAGSYANGAPGYAGYNSIYNLVGTTTSPQAQNTTTSLGVNGANTTSAATAFPVPLQGNLLFANVAVDSTPATGQTYTFNLIYNGTTIGTATIASGQFTAVITPTGGPVAVNLGGQVWIQSIFSATSGSATPRYSITFQG
jgi:hypothetical protein